jgi:hypothetical protein
VANLLLKGKALMLLPLPLLPPLLLLLLLARHYCCCSSIGTPLPPPRLLLPLTAPITFRGDFCGFRQRVLDCQGSR